MNDTIQGHLGKGVDGKKSRRPAVWDRWQSITGFILACFILLHMLFTSSIIFGKDFFNKLIDFAEGGFIFSAPVPIITNFIAFGVFVIFISHAFLAMRKFPANFKQYLLFRGHKKRFKHLDTSLWWVQFITGFFLFFSASAHLVDIMFSKKISADNSIANFGRLEFFYPFLLVFMVLHGSIGMYRLYVKWIGIDGFSKEIVQAKRIKVKIIIFSIFGILAVLSIVADFVWAGILKPFF